MTQPASKTLDCRGDPSSSKWSAWPFQPSYFLFYSLFRPKEEAEQAVSEVKDDDQDEGDSPKKDGEDVDSDE